MSKSWLVNHGPAVVVAENTTQFFYTGTVAVSTTEAQQEAAVRDACTMRNLAIRSSANTVSAASAGTLRKSVAYSAVTCTITADTTGDFSDTTHSESFAATDEFCLKVAAGDDPVSGNLSITGWSVEIEPTTGSNTISLLQLGGTVSMNAASTTYYIPPGGTMTAPVTTEAAQQLAVGFACTARNLRVYVSSNGRAQPTTVTSRKNGADGSQTVTIGGSATGVFEDTVPNTDTLAQGDLYCFKAVTGTGAGTVTVVSLGSTLVSTGRSFQFVSSLASGTNIATATTRYSALGGRVSGTATESEVAAPAPFGMTVSRLYANVLSNVSDGTTTVTFRLASADTALTLSIGAAATGKFYDNANEVAVAAGQKVNNKIVNAGAGGITITMTGAAGRTAAGRSFAQAA